MSETAYITPWVSAHPTGVLCDGLSPSCKILLLPDGNLRSVPNDPGGFRYYSTPGMAERTHGSSHGWRDRERVTPAGMRSLDGI
jgi:hypothetical protein